MRNEQAPGIRPTASRPHAAVTGRAHGIRAGPAGPRRSARVRAASGRRPRPGFGRCFSPEAGRVGRRPRLSFMHGQLIGSSSTLGRENAADSDGVGVFSAKADELRTQDPDRGEIVNTAVVIGILAAGAILVGAILIAKAVAAANNVQTQ